MAKSTKPLPFPLFDADRVTAAQQRNLDALASASQIVVDGYKALAQRQSEMVRASVERFLGTRGFDRPMDFHPADHIAAAKSMYEAAVHNAQQLTGIARERPGEDVGVLTRYAMATLD